MELDIGQIMEILPHRQPFLLIDAVEELEPGKRAVARKCVSYNEPYFGGHFPGEPVMPGVLIVEALAQTGAVAILSMDENRGKTAYFAEINRARFKKKVVPGDVLTLTTEIIRRKGPIGIGSATATVRGEVVCAAELTFAIGSKEEYRKNGGFVSEAEKRIGRKSAGGGSTGAAGDDCVPGLRQGDQ